MNSRISIDSAISEAGLSNSVTVNPGTQSITDMGSGVSSSFNLPVSESAMPGVDTSSARPYLGGPANDRPGYVSE